MTTTPRSDGALIAGLDVEIDGPSSVLAGEAFLSRIYEAVRSSASEKGSNAFNTMLFVGFDEPGGPTTTSHRGPCRLRDRRSRSPQLGFAFDRSGYRVPAVIVSPWVPSPLRLHR